MPEIEDALRYEILTDADVAALAGSRVHANHAPQGGAMPYVTLHRVSGERERAASGPIGLAHPRIQVDCVAARYADAKALASAIRRNVDGLRGDAGAPGRKVYINQVFLEDDVDLYLDPLNASDKGRHVVSLDLIVWHAET